MELLDDTVGSIVNTGFDLAKENLGGIFTNMTLFSMLLLSLNKDKPFPKTSNTFKRAYDYIIVGAGTAGSVMANRLTENPCVTVLLLEAGGYAPLLTEIPAFARLLYNTSIDWHYYTTPQKYGAFGQNENRVVWNSGKGLGGGSIINSMLYVRGNKKNYDDWKKEGCTGWGYEDVLPIFKKFEDNQNLNDPEIDREYHGGGKPMTVEKPKYEPEIKKAILKATAKLGYGVTDVNGRRQTGIYDLQGTLRNGQRCSTAKAYLVPAENRPNLTILKRAFVTKILIHGKAAYGVQFDFGGRSNKVLAKKEVIVSAGTVRTPQILMLSGIGPRRHLRRFKIRIVADLPVGKNLQDHFATNLNYVLSPLIQNVVVKAANPINILKYLTDRSGPLASPSQVTLMAFLDGLNTTTKSPDFPRQQLYFAEYSPVDALKNYNMKLEYYAGYYGPYTIYPFAVYTCIVSVLQPYSRGEILLNSANPRDLPLINPNYYQDIRDLKDVVEGMKICEAVANSPALKKIGAKSFKTTYPGCERYRGNDSKFFGCMALSLITSFWHTVGTSRMGQPDDPRSVVDPQLRVIGVRNLRVIDASVMPIVPSGNTNVPTMMVAEKAYEMMKKNIKCSGRRRICKRRNN